MAQKLTSLHPDQEISLKKPVGLKRQLTLFQITAAGVGVILGAGIYALIGAASGYSGNAVWISFFIASFVAALTGLSYAELSSMYTDDSGEFRYVGKAFGRKLGIFAGFAIMFSGISTAAAVALSFGGYLSALINTPVILAAIGSLLLFTLINYIGIKESITINIIFTAIEMLGLLIIIGLGISRFGSIDYLAMPNGWTGVFHSAALIFFAYLGFEEIVKLSEETKKPQRNIPLGLLLAIVITSVIYMLVALSAVSIMPWDQLAASKAPLADVAATALGPLAFIVLGVIALFSTANTSLMSLISESRMMYGLAKRKVLPKMLSTLGKRRTPVFSIFLAFILAFFLVLIGDIEIVANIANFCVFIVFILVNASVIMLRSKAPNTKRKFKIPFNIAGIPVSAVFGLVASAVLMAYTVLNLF
ncbi:APC family permease [Nanoarchaeota archaeon]